MRNRRTRWSIAAYLLNAFLALLALSGMLGKKKSKPQGKKRLSEIERDRYAEHLYSELQRIGG